jgi:hypothetical protein
MALLAAEVGGPFLAIKRFCVSLKACCEISGGGKSIGGLDGDCGATVEADEEEESRLSTIALFLCSFFELSSVSVIPFSSCSSAVLSVVKGDRATPSASFLLTTSTTVPTSEIALDGGRGGRGGGVPPSDSSDEESTRATQIRSLDTF